MCSGEEYEWLVVVVGVCVWVRMGTYGCIGLSEREKQTRKDTHGQLHMISPNTCLGKGYTERVTTSQ